MGTATILGTDYPTVVMPDGNEWMAENLAWTTVGLWWNNGPSDDGDGRYYTRNQAWEIVAPALTGSGWGLPTLAEWRAMIAAIGGTVAGGKLKAVGTVEWAAPNTGATNEFGFNSKAAGFLWTSGSGWVNKTTSHFMWAADEEDAPTPNISYAGLSNSTGDITISGASDPDVFFFSLRLVRRYTPPAPPEITAEAHETTHALALEWTEAADGTPVAYDDGTAYDYIESTITARLTAAELATLETAWQSSTKLYTIYSTGYLLGPLIDMSAGVEVRLMSYQVDQSADSAMTLYDVTIGVHYGPLSAPSAGSLAVVQSRGRPYHSVAPGAASWITEGGTSDVNAYGRASERSCTWFTHSLTTAQAADVVNALRTLRGSSTTWTAGGVATPWGPSESGTAIVWIPEWSVHRESNLLWGVQMELVRNG